MTPAQASAAWQQRQAKTLKQTYTAGWKTGVRNYQSQHATPPATAAATAAPTVPAAAPMQQALTPALTSLARMGAQLAIIVPTVVQLAAAGTAIAAIALAAREWLQANAYLLAGGVSAAWAGEQHGYAQAANADGLLLDWELDPRAEHCSDCPALAALPPLPLGVWPTLPGDGATECATGCKCSMRAVAADAPVLTAEQEQTLLRVASKRPALVAA